VGKGGSREKWGEMTQTVYTHMNKIKINKKSLAFSNLRGQR
jgi:hypothetical protein